MSRLAYTLAFTVLSGLVILVIWLPFGFEMGGLIEEWGYLGLVNLHGASFIVGTESVLPSLAMRPFTFLMPALATLFEPNTFVFWHIFLIVSLVLKGSLGGWYVFRISGSPLFGLLTSVLIIVYPADTMQISFRSLHINWAISFVMFGACVLIAALEARSSLRNYFIAVLAGVFVVLGLGMYEASFALLLLIPSYFFVKQGLRTSLALVRDQVKVWFLFLGIVGLYGVYLIIVGRQGDASYQSSLVGSSQALEVLSVTWSKLFTVGGLHLFLGAWADGFKLLFDQPMRNLVYVVFSTVLLTVSTAIVFQLLPRLDVSETSRRSDPTYVRLMLAGGLIALVGYLPYLLSPPHLAISQRTFLAAGPGATLLYVAVIAQLSKHSRAIACFMMFCAIFLGLAVQLNQFSHYQYLSDYQRKFLNEIFEQYDDSTDKKLVVIEDYSNMLGHTWMFLPENLGNALSYASGDKIGSLEICHQPAGEWMRRDTFGRTGRCYVKDGEWVFEKAQPATGPGVGELVEESPAMKMPVEAVLAISVGRKANDLEGEVSSTLWSDQIHAIPQPDRTGLYSDGWVLKNLLWKPSYENVSCYRWDFGNVWSLELPIRGNGWREAEWEVLGLNKVAAAWKVSEVANLYFQLQPKNVDYLISFQMVMAANANILPNLALSINEKNLPITFNGMEGKALVPKDVLEKGLNVLVFKSPVAPDYYGLSFFLDSVELRPRETRANRYASCE